MGWLFSGTGAIGRFFNRRRQAKEATDLLVVRCGLSPAFYFFCQMFASENGLIVVPDRRAKDRRHRQQASASIDRRHSDDRRRAMSRDRQMEDFWVVRGNRASDKAWPKPGSDQGRLKPVGDQVRARAG